MKFISHKPEKNVLSLVRELGYVLKSNQEGEFNCVKTITSMSYPRFHLFIEEKDNDFLFKLHLDQKKPSYSGNSAHSGEYEGGIIEKEAQRIKQIVEK